MEEMSRMRIICDPYKKEIEYQWYDSNVEDYVEFDPEYSKLMQEEYTNATIQSRAYEIIDIINRECNVGNTGLEIRFIGTEDDYENLKHVIDTYYDKLNIICSKGEYYYDSAVRVMPKIKAKFSEIQNTINQYTEDEITKLIQKYSDTIKPSISLCVMGLYSSGKSALINSIIGAEILPSASDPTTAKVCKITCGKKYAIKFLFDSKECKLSFEGNTYKPNSNFDKEIIKKLQKIVESNTIHNEIFHMNRALDIINNYNSEKHGIGDIIEVEVPFNNTKLPVNEFDFVIYDTPGSNSDNNVRHFEVLRDSLDEQTNALPVFVTTPDTMDVEDNDKILKLIENTGTALDKKNALIVVNKADEKGPKTLSEKKEKCKNLKITKWKSTQIFFVSSVIGIASKKCDPQDERQWLDEDMYEIYDDKNAKYSSDERKLFEFNILDKSKVTGNAEYLNNTLSEHLYKNSGLEAVEKEIMQYAEKYALYNKCQQASVYLQKAIDLCYQNVQEVEIELQRTLSKAQEKFDSKETLLCKKLNENQNKISEYNQEFQTEMNKCLEKFIKENALIADDSKSQKELKKLFDEKWKSLNKEGKKIIKNPEWAWREFQNWLDQNYNIVIDKFCESANEKIDVFWDKKAEEFKKQCQRIIHDSKDLTQEQKGILESITLSKSNMVKQHIRFDLDDKDGKKKIVKKWRIFKNIKITVNMNNCVNEFIKTFNDTVREKSTKAENQNKKSFKEWTTSLITRLKSELCTFNSNLDDLNKKIEELNDAICKKEECKELLDKSKNYIDMLLDIQEGDQHEQLL